MAILELEFSDQSTLQTKPIFDQLLKFNDPKGWLSLQATLSRTGLLSAFEQNKSRYQQHSNLLPINSAIIALKRVNKRLVTSDLLDSLLELKHITLATSAIKLMTAYYNQLDSKHDKLIKQTPGIKQIQKHYHHYKQNQALQMFLSDSLHALKVCELKGWQKRRMNLTVRDYGQVCLYSWLLLQAYRQDRPIGRLPSDIIAHHIFSFLGTGKHVTVPTAKAILDQRLGQSITQNTAHEHRAVF